MSKLLDQILSRDNLLEAYKQVKTNKGSAGIDGVTIDILDLKKKEADYLPPEGKSLVYLGWVIGKKEKDCDISRMIEKLDDIVTIEYV